MAFASFFQAKFTKTLLRQLMAIIQRDATAAIDYVTGVPGSLRPWVEYSFSAYTTQVRLEKTYAFEQFPFLMMIPRSVDFFDPESVQSRESTNRIEIMVGVANQDRNLMVEQAEDYVRAVDVIVSSLGAQVNNNSTPNFNDFYTPLPLVVPYPQSPAQSVISDGLGGPVTTDGMQPGSVKACYPVSHEYGEVYRASGVLQMTAVMAAHILVEET